MIFALVTLLLSPWHGVSLPTASAAAVKYQLTVQGAAAQRVQLHASGLSSGWVASFCTRRLCSPFRYGMTLDSRGTGTIEFQLIRVDDAASRHTHAAIAAAGAKPVFLNI